jgi:hypothetical protein
MAFSIEEISHTGLALLIVLYSDDPEDWDCLATMEVTELCEAG